MKQTLWVVCIILGNVGLMPKGNQADPPGKIEPWGNSEFHPGNRTIWGGKLEWKEAGNNRTQGNFTCQKGNQCRIGNWTATCPEGCKLRTGPGQGVFYFTANQNITLTVNFSLVSMSCQKETNMTGLRDRTWLKNWAKNVTGGRMGVFPEVTLNSTSWYGCTNSTPISKRTTYGTFWWLQEASQEETNSGHLRRIFTTCTQVVRSPNILNLTVQIKYIPLKSDGCNITKIDMTLEKPEKKGRERRDVLGTVIGGIGTGIGALNSMDIETLQNKIQTVGDLVGEGIKVRNVWNKGLQKTQMSRYPTNVMTWQHSEAVEKEIEQEMISQAALNSNYTYCMMKEIAAEG